MESNCASSAEELVDHIFNAVSTHAEGVEAFDDQTIVCLKVKGPAAANFFLSNVNPAELAKHARVVESDEIEENEHNLNIPRYVDTFEPEEPIDMAATVKALQSASIRQQAAEKAIKALLIKQGVVFPYVHDLARLVTILEEAGEPIPETIRNAEELTRYAVMTRCPGLAEPVTETQYEEAIATAEAVIQWAANRPREARMILLLRLLH